MENEEGMEEKRKHKTEGHSLEFGKLLGISVMGDSCVIARRDVSENIVEGSEQDWQPAESVHGTS